MRCYCYEKDCIFTFCVEEVEMVELEEAILHAAWQKDGNRFILTAYQPSDSKEKELISKNFSEYGEALFYSMVTGFHWQKPLDKIAQIFNENEIEWYVVGSAGDAARGIQVQPHDIDIVVHTKDFYKVKDVCYSTFTNAIISPFMDNLKHCPLRYFGRMFLEGALIDIAADEAWNMENRRPTYEKYIWNNHTMYMDALSLRYKIETARKRVDGVKAIEEYMKDNPTL